MLIVLIFEVIWQNFRNKKVLLEREGYLFYGE